MAHEHENEHHSHWPLFLRVVLSLTLALLGHFLWNESRVPWWVNLLIMVSAFLIISYDILWEMIEGMVKDHAFFTEETLMVLASAGAFSLRAFGPEHNEYLEAVLVMLLFQVGEFFQHVAEEKSKKSLISAFDIRQELANVSREGHIVCLRSEELQKGDRVLLKAGEKCLCDGVVISGSGTMNESSLTGESEPIEKRIGSPVFGGTILQSGGMEIEVKNEYKDSTIAKLFELIDHGNEQKAKTARFIDRFARVYTPVVTLIALLVAAVPPLIVNPSNATVWAQYVYAALSFLVVSCPCAVVLSVPLAYFSGLGLASKNGILVKGATHFDTVSRLRAVAFDKTGTLTQGQFSISKIVSFSGDDGALIQGLSIAESCSNHPIAKAILESNSGTIDANEIQEHEEVPGQGTRVVFAGRVYEAVKNPKLAKNKASDDVFGTIVYLIVDGVDQGYCVLEDSVKPTSYSAIARLHEQGLSAVLLSGDKENVVKRVANELRIDSYFASLTPAEKSQILTKERNRLGPIAFVGDGINDAPTLTLADVGIAMGGLGSDLAVNQADVVLLDDDPMGVDRFIRIARKTERRAISCIALALGAKAIIMALSFIGASTGAFEMPLWVSVFGDSGVALLAVLLALSLFFAKMKK